MNRERQTLPRCRHGCWPAVILVAVPEGCLCFPADRKQWLCHQHFTKLIGEREYEVLADIVSLGWAVSWVPSPIRHRGVGT